MSEKRKKQKYTLDPREGEHGCTVAFLCIGLTIVTMTSLAIWYVV